MKTRAAVAWEAGKPLTIETIEIGGPKAGEVLVEVMATGICHTDAYTLSGLDSEGKFPAILGHEGAGIVREVGGILGAAQPAAQPGLQPAVMAAVEHLEAVVEGRGGHGLRLRNVENSSHLIVLACPASRRPLIRIRFGAPAPPSRARRCRRPPPP